MVNFGSASTKKAHLCVHSKSNHGSAFTVSATALTVPVSLQVHLGMTPQFVLMLVGKTRLIDCAHRAFILTIPTRSRSPKGGSLKIFCQESDALFPVISTTVSCYSILYLVL